MNPGQQMFYEFMMERVFPDKKTEADLLLRSGFEKQAAGEFTPAYLEKVKEQYFALIKPEYAKELEQAMAHFSAKM